MGTTSADLKRINRPNWIYGKSDVTMFWTMARCAAEVFGHVVKRSPTLLCKWRIHNQEAVPTFDSFDGGSHTGIS
ncbi:MAG: hypothetical protein WCK77_08300 [Verrucomicrobiota bacterium]